MSRTRSGTSVGLPRPLSSLVGRSVELAEIEDRLTSGTIRLLTLTGPGGVGKTRLALELGHRLGSHFQAGARLVPLTSIHDASQVVPAIGRAIGIRRSDTVEMPDVIAALRDTEMLLVIDNFEHVIDAAVVVSELLSACPRVTALVTSRSNLHLSGEHVYPLPPMQHASPSAPPEEILATDAAQLFIDRAMAVAPDLPLTPAATATIAAICERLEGMPLAIELAAAHASTLSLDELLARLGERLPVLEHGPRDQPERLQTMRAAIAWGYELLAPQERRLLRRLATFEVTFGLEIVEALLEVDVPEGGTPEDPLGFLERLVSQSFVRHIIIPAGFSRYVILEVVREFLLAQIAASGESEAVQAARLAASLEFGRRAATHLLRTVDPVWLDRIEMEHATIQAALDWGFAASSLEARRQAAQLAGELWLFWYYHGHLATARTWLDRAAELEPALSTADRARIYLGLGTVLHYQGETDRAATALTLARELADAANDRHLLAYALTALGAHAEDLGRYAAADEQFRAAERLFRAENDLVNVAVTLYHRGVVAFGEQDLDRARTVLGQGLTLARETGDPWATCAVLAWLGMVHLRAGELDAAAAVLREALDIFRRIGSQERIAGVLRATAVLAAGRSRHRDAVRLFAAAGAMSNRIGMQLQLPESAVYEETLATLRAELADRDFDSAWERGEEMRQAEAIELAVSVLAGGSTPVRPPHPVASSQLPVPLSEREIEVLRLLVEGMTDADIADTLSISRRTAATHIRHIYDKIDVTSRAAAAAWAVRNGVA